MMKNILILPILLIAFSAFSQISGDLTVKINEIKKQSKGQMIIMLFESEDGFPKETEKAKYKATVQEFGSKLTYTFEGIPHGVYAVAIIQDLNQNNKIDSNWMGMPKEPVGASKQKSMGKPKFSRSQFDFKEKRQVVEMEFIND